MSHRRWAAFILLASVGLHRPAWSAFSPHGTPIAISASASISKGSTSGSLDSFILLSTPLPTSAFFGKNAIIPIQLIDANGPVSPSNVSVSIVYQLSNGNGLLPISNPIPVPLSVDPKIANALDGTAVINAVDLQPIQNGGQLYYIFKVSQNGAGVIFGDKNSRAPAPNTLSNLDPSVSFATSIDNSLCFQVGPSATTASVPDLFVPDGKTSVSLGAGALTRTGTLCIQENSTTGWPTGPGGAMPIVVYTITLNDASLTQTAGITLSYASDSAGNVQSLNANASQPINPNDLGLYWLGPEGVPTPNQSWIVLSRSTVDPTLHTVSGTSGHFSTFALFAAGATSSATSIRPPQRIITPNGDHQNDVAIFSGLSGRDDVRIFDIRGRRIRHITAPSSSGDCGGNYCWDGTDDGGAIVESGVYIYQYTSQGERVSGVIMVAK